MTKNIKPKHAARENSTPSPERDRVNITLPTWLRDESALYGAKRGYGMSELVTRLLEKFVDDEKARIAMIEAMDSKAKKGLT